MAYQKRYTLGSSILSVSIISTVLSTRIGISMRSSVNRQHLTEVQLRLAVMEVDIVEDLLRLRRRLTSQSGVLELQM